MPEPSSHKLLVISFDDRLRAQEFLLAVARLQKDNDLQMHDAVFVQRDADGRSHVTETTDVTPGRGALGGGVWGLLLGTLFGGPIGGVIVGAATAGGGALYAKLVDTGIKDSTVAQLRTVVPPGRTGLALLVSHVSLGDLQRELARFPGADLVETDLPPAAVMAVQEALAEANRQPFSDAPAGAPMGAPAASPPVAPPTSPGAPPVAPPTSPGAPPVAPPADR